MTYTVLVLASLCAGYVAGSSPHRHRGPKDVPEGAGIENSKEDIAAVKSSIIDDTKMVGLESYKRHPYIK